MSRMRKGLAALGLSVALAAGPCLNGLPQVYAEEPSLEDQLESLQQEAEAQQRVTEQIEAKIADATVDLEALMEQEAEAAAEHRHLRNNLEDTESKIAANQQLLAETQDKLDKREQVLKKRVRDIYIHGRISYLDVLFGANDFKDFMTRMDLLSRVIKADLQLVGEIRKDREVVETARAALEKDRIIQSELAERARYKEIEMTNKRSQKDAVIASMEADREASQALYDEALAASAEVERLIRQRDAASHGSSGEYHGVGSGQMIWPIMGEITSEYGYRVHPIYGDERYHSGLDIAGDYGEPILAAAAGVVIHAGWISGYGYTIIVDHGGGITSLYAHNEELAVGEGDNVAQGQVIAYCGSTGNSTGPHCHFEVREGGSPVSPYGYL